ncbi:GntR family transcriptional regulator [Aquipuribacter sp. MA13-6]|uniref:GntR family transcriptional regulator n=1 Tax=unclassified Aquipuribacter TaxID=2635084 RepID=UPI003EEAC6C8
MSRTDDRSDDRRRPASRVIADALRERIESGDLPEGGQLPSERQLAAWFDAARNTAREAVRILTDEGLVIAHHGQGVFVRQRHPLIRLGIDRYSPRHRDLGLSPFLLECQRQGKTGRFEVLSITQERASSDVASRLGTVDGDDVEVTRRENVFYADDDPVYRVSTFLLAALTHGTDLSEPVIDHPYGIHGRLEETGHTMTRILEDVTARMPTPDEANRLALPKGSPVLDVWHTSVDQNGDPYEVTRFVMRADLTALHYNTPVE